MKIKRVLEWATTELSEACERPRLEAELLLAHHLEKKYKMKIKVNFGTMIEVVRAALTADELASYNFV